MEDVDKWLAAVGLKLVNVVIAAASSFAALNFWKGLERRSERWSTAFGGWAIAAWGAEPLSVWLDLKPATEKGLVILLGLFGMAVAAEVYKLIRTADWATITRFFRGGKNGGDK